MLIRDLDQNGSNSRFFKTLIAIMATEYKSVCKTGCHFEVDRAGQCKSPDFAYAPPPRRDFSRDCGLVPNPPTYPPTTPYEPATIPARV